MTRPQFRFLFGIAGYLLGLVHDGLWCDLHDAILSSTEMMPWLAVHRR